jgi:hypothetical protein
VSAALPASAPTVIQRRWRSFFSLPPTRPASVKITSCSRRLMKKLLPLEAEGGRILRSRLKVRESVPSTRSIGLPSWVPLVKYTPRTSGCSPKREPPKAFSMNSDSSGRSALNCCGKL